MTITEGYPDWQRVQSRAFIPMLNQTFDTGGATTDKGPFYVTNFPLVMVSVILTGSSFYNIDLRWLDTAAAAIPLYIKTVSVGPNVSVYKNAFPVLSPYLQIRVFPVTYVAGDVVSLVVTPSTNPSTPLDVNGAYLIEQNALSVAAGATTIVYASAIIEGPASLHWRTAATTWTVDTQIQNTLGTFSSRYFFDQAMSTAENTVAIVLPAAPVRTRLINGDAVARNFNLTLGTNVF